MLGTGLDVPQVFEDGFSMVQLKALAPLRPDTVPKIECMAMQSSQTEGNRGCFRQTLGSRSHAQNVREAEMKTPS